MQLNSGHHPAIQSTRFAATAPNVTLTTVQLCPTPREVLVILSGQYVSTYGRTACVKMLENVAAIFVSDFRRSQTLTSGLNKPPWGLPKTRNRAYWRTCTTNTREAPCTKQAYRYLQHSEQRNYLNFGQKQIMVHALQLAGLSSLVHDRVVTASLESLLWLNVRFICMYSFFPR
jgi:hypothetical protein